MQITEKQRTKEGSQENKTFLQISTNLYSLVHFHTQLSIFINNPVQFYHLWCVTITWNMVRDVCSTNLTFGIGALRSQGENRKAAVGRWPGRDNKRKGRFQGFLPFPFSAEKAQTPICLSQCYEETHSLRDVASNPRMQIFTKSFQISREETGLCSFRM